MSRWIWSMCLVAACGAEAPPSPGETGWLGRHAHTLKLGQSDNAEVVTLIGDRAALVLASKARKVVRLSVLSDRLEIAREAVLFADDATESELTHAQVASSGEWAALTRTLITTEGGAQTDCGGEVVFIDVRDADSFGAVLARIPVGPMPDNVDISDDDTLVVVANERDGPDAWGKCEVPGEQASISVIDVSSGPATARETHRIVLTDGDTGPREPEAVVILGNDRVAVTLQDSHEVALFDVSALPASPTMADLTLVRLPDDALGAGMWPDGITRVTPDVLAVAGEWNDTLCLINAQGAVISTIRVSASDLPAALPRVVDEGSPPFSPDTVAAFSHGGRRYLAATLRHAGAVAVYDVTDPTAPTYATAIAVGHDEQGGQDETGSTIRPEGLAAAPDGSFLLTANEVESSVTLIVASP